VQRDTGLATWQARLWLTAIEILFSPDLSWCRMAPVRLCAGHDLHPLFANHNWSSRDEKI
jgi:hypothetical protein